LIPKHLHTLLKRNYFITVIDGEFCLKMSVVQRPKLRFYRRSSRLSGALRAVIIFQTLQCKISDKSRSRVKLTMDMVLSR